MPFLNLNKRFETPAEYAAWLYQHPKPTWGVQGTTYHNTYIPNKLQWRGHDSMISMADTYAGKGWSTGPHLYLATGTRFDGIYVMCPPWEEAIHGLVCNKDHFGIENVDDWDMNQPTEAQKALFVEVTAINHAWAGIGPNLNAHKDCGPRTCPGRYGYAVKAELQRRLAMTLNTTRLEPDRVPGSLSPYTEDSLIVAPPPGDEETFVSALLDRATGGNYNATAVNEIARAYWKVATAGGVDPWLAAGQCMHETGWLTSWWCARPRRNGCGYGVTGFSVPRAEYERHPDSYPDSAWTWSDDHQTRLQGISFPSWAQHEVPAHIGRLLAYAVLPVDQTPEQAALVRYALSLRSLPTTYSGTAPKLKDLDRKWAAGLGYGTRVAQAANRLRGIV